MLIHSGIMERFVIKKLKDWKDQKHRKPLILRGTRQVGKTWSILNLGKNHFNGNVHVIDLEKHPDWHRVFEPNLDVKRILSEFEILLNTKIDPERDLLFFDEIQNCSRALMALRYFYEELPQLHIIAAGSLLGFAFKDISFPVSRAQFLNLHPMSFAELGKDKLVDIILSKPIKLSEIIHNMLLDELRKYFFIGGMPECVQYFAETNSIRSVMELQLDLINTFRQDFSKYTPYSNKHCLNQVLSSTVKNVGKQLKYSRLAEDFTNPTIKKAFILLCKAQIIHKVSSTNPGGLPLGASASERIFKSIMVDIGLMQSICGIPVDIEYNKSDLLSIYQGALAEQFVGQEFMAAGHSELFYWSRRAKSSTAEVDFLIESKGKIIPVEVKSSVSGRLKSMHILLREYQNCPVGYVFSCAPYSKLPGQRLIFLPLYYAFQKGMA